MKVPRILELVLGLILVVGSALLSVAPASAASTATVSVLHAIPGATVDVYANGKALLTDFKPGTLTDPQQLPATTYDLKVVAAGAGANGKAVVEAKGVKVPAGSNVTVVAHLSEDGKPVLTPFVNDVSSVPAGKTRLVVRHTAAAPEVDVRAGGKPVFTGLSNPDEDEAVVAAGTVDVDVVLAGTDTVAIGPAELDLAEGTTTIAYAWGSAADKNLKLAVQTIDGMGGHPNGVPAGDGGQLAAADHRVATGASALVLLGLVGLVVSGVQLRRRRSATV